MLSDQALRIKTKADATDSTVSGITYTGNTATGMREFGVLIDQVCYADLHQSWNGISPFHRRYIELSRYPRHPWNWCEAFGMY